MPGTGNCTGSRRAFGGSSPRRMCAQDVCLAPGAGAGTISAEKIRVGGHIVNELFRDVGQGAVMLHLQDAELKRPIRGEQVVTP